ncbi:hypothetical protein BC830DRAFT_1129666 [Chytriomyces sp. MP71]|nr:hypothetical protein BC830DRAFT_1129666 [Chytriomyces sp. MP71]
MLSLAILDLILTFILVRFIGGFVLSYLPEWPQQATTTGCHCRMDPVAAGCQRSCPASTLTDTPTTSECPMRQARSASTFHVRPPFPFSQPRFPQIQFRPVGLPLEILQALLAQDTPVLRPARTPSPRSSPAFAPRTEQPKPTARPTHTFSDNAKDFTLTVDIPGFKRGEVTLTVTDDTRVITIAGASATRNPMDFKLVVPRLGDLRRVAASMEDGVLTVVVPKLERDGRVVEVSAGGYGVVAGATPSSGLGAGAGVGAIVDETMLGPGASEGAAAGYEFA